MARLTKAQAGEIVREHIGINPQTFKVEWVSETRGGSISVWRGDNYIVHNLAGREARNECVIVLGLTDIYSIPVVMYQSESTKRKVAELEEKAATMKAQADEKKT